MYLQPNEMLFQLSDSEFVFVLGSCSRTLRRPLLQISYYTGYLLHMHEHYEQHVGGQGK